uniref:Uncharacterized protein n=1 Tax=Strigamia maritima TaxID=126957 RepID=T1IXT9_STRMM
MKKQPDVNFIAPNRRMPDKDSLNKYHIIYRECKSSHFNTQMISKDNENLILTNLFGIYEFVFVAESPKSTQKHPSKFHNTKQQNTSLPQPQKNHPKHPTLPTKRRGNVMNCFWVLLVVKISGSEICCKGKRRHDNNTFNVSQTAYLVARDIVGHCWPGRVLCLTTQLVFPMLNAYMVYVKLSRTRHPMGIDSIEIAVIVDCAVRGFKRHKSDEGLSIETKPGQTRKLFPNKLRKIKFDHHTIIKLHMGLTRNLLKFTLGAFKVKLYDFYLNSHGIY